MLNYKHTKLANLDGYLEHLGVCGAFGLWTPSARWARFRLFIEI